MKQTDFKKFSTDITLLAELFGKELSSAMVGLYFRALDCLPMQQVTTALSKAARELKFFPKPAELIELVKYREPKPEDKAQVAVTKILDHMRKFGSSLQPDLSDDPIADDLMTRRWPYRQWSGDILTSEIKWWTKEFIDAYVSYSATCTAPQIESEKLKQITGDMFKSMQ